MNFAVIPARGGSKRIKRKNVKEFCGLPIIAWSIKAAKESGCFDQVIVSTEDEEIAEVARHYGANIPFLRPSELADDFTGTGPVMEHAINWFIDNNVAPEFFCCIYPTAPFLSAHDIQAGLHKIENEHWDYVFSAAVFEAPVQRAFRLSSNGVLYMMDPTSYEKRSQDLERTYFDAGQFYWGRSQAWLNNHNIFDSLSNFIVIPNYRVRDIDNPEDWTHAELLFETLRRRLIL